MENSIFQDHYNGVRVYVENDLGDAWQLQKAESIMSSFVSDKNIRI